MKKTMFNLFITLIAMVVVGVLFYIGFYESRFGPVNLPEFISGWFNE